MTETYPTRPCRKLGCPRRGMRMAVFAVALALPTLAHARCPVAGDLDAGGIRFVYDDGTSEVLRSGPDGTTVADGLTDGTIDRRLTLLHGVFLARYVPVDATEPGAPVEVSGEAVVYAFPEGDEALPPPVAGARWQGIVTTIFADGATATELQMHVAGPSGQMTVGGCAVEGFAIDVTFAEVDIGNLEFGGDIGYTESLVYLPALGIGYLAGYANTGDALQNISVKTLEAIE